MKKTLIIGALLLGGIVTAQTKENKPENPKANTDSVSYWSKGALFNLGFSQVSLSNWAAGGNSSVSGNAILNLHSNYKKGLNSWENSLNLGYGLLKQDETDVQKTDDNFEFTSKYGRERSKHWSYAALVNFNTQFAAGYDHPNDSTKISTCLAPGYLYGALGMDYKPTTYLSVFLSPLTSKTTIVTEENLSNAGAFGVEVGEKVRNEFGGYIRANITKEIMKNVKLTSTVSLFSNYLEEPENVDVNWEMLILMKVNKYITVSLNTKLIYDHDINIVKDTNGDGNNNINGPRTQFKEILSVGFSYKL
jgi:hypothetical protein